MRNGDPKLDRPFLERLAPVDRTVLDGLLNPKTFRESQLIITQNEESSDVFFVLKGHARATIFSENGKVVAYRDIPSGGIFGELSAIDKSPRSASVLAVTDIEVGTLSGGQFRQLIQTSPSFNWTLLEYMAWQARWMTERIFEFSTMLVRERLILELLRFAEAAGASKNQATLKPAPTHFDLAVRISTHREAVSREMSKLAKLGLVAKKPGGLLLRDLDSLRSLTKQQGE